MSMLNGSAMENGSGFSNYSSKVRRKEYQNKSLGVELPETVTIYSSVYFEFHAKVSRALHVILKSPKFDHHEEN